MQPHALPVSMRTLKEWAQNRKEVAIDIIKKPSCENKMSVLCAFAIHASTFLQYALYKAAKGETTVRDDVSNIYKCKTTGYF